MRALVMTGAGNSERTELRDVPVPRPGPGEVTIDVAFAGLNFMDVMARRGDPGYATSWPYTPGLEVAGTLRELGEGVEGLVVGQRVAAVTTGGGGLAEVAPAKAVVTVPVPDGVELSTAAATPLGAATAMLLLDSVGHFAAGETVLMHSAGGGIGGLVAELVPLLGGGRLLGTVGRPDKAAAAAERGYEAVFPRGEGLVDAVRTATGGHGADLILDPLGTTALEDDFAMVAPGGRIVLFGNAGGGTPAPLPPAGRLIGGNITLSGFSHRGLTAAAPAKVTAALRRTLGLVARGELAVRVTELASLADVAAVHDLMAEGRGEGKYVVRGH